MMKVPTAAGLLVAILTTVPPASARPFAPSEKVPATVTLTTPERVAYTAAFEQQIAQTYVQAQLLPAGLPLEVFRRGVVGLYNLQQRGLVSRRCHVLTIIDFSRPSTQERLWVVDVAKHQLLQHTLVAHGRNSGEEYAQNFSNVASSEMSSLGFYITGDTYQGKHGLSLKLHGVDAGYNSNALSRSVVVHGASYVSSEFVQQHGRLGRSQGCPALPLAQTPAIIRTIKGGTVVFANGPATVAYESKWLRFDWALLAFARSKGRLLRAG